MQKSFRIRLHILSPVHIGCDDVYEPTGFIVDRLNKKLIAFEPIDFVRQLPEADRKKFFAICEKGTLESIVETYRFMNNCKEKIDGHSVAISDGFIASYDRVTKINAKDRKAIQQELNKFLVSRTSYLPFDQAPYIPGSTLKGALRTGWLNHLNNRHAQQGLKAKSLEQQLLGGKFATDPFRLVKVSDLLPVGPLETKICFGFFRKRNPKNEKDSSPSQILEVVQPSGIFEGVITLQQPEKGAEIKNPVPVLIDFFKNVGAFYDREMQREENNLQQMKLPAIIRGDCIKKFEDQFLTSVFPVRIGRHSGAECLTIEGARSIKIMHSKPPLLPFRASSTTIWVAANAPRATNGLKPFGWAALEVLEMDTVSPYPKRNFAHQSNVSTAVSLPIAQHQPQRPLLEQVIWENVPIGWQHGTGTITASASTGQKLSGDTSLVSEETIVRLRKGKSVMANVTLSKEGNLLKILKVELI